jgi:predicted ATP-dependent endonuclease of OLD family
MTYAYSQIDNSNLKWFQNDSTAYSLLAIEISRGNLRGLHSTSVSFSYPITAIAGQNGAGKTTVLALAACAYHNTAIAYNPFGRRNPYYTISDFFIQSTVEQPVEGIVLKYRYLHDRWKSDTGTQDGPSWQKREKTKGGRWTNYDRRVKRSVAFLGIERVVPESEHRVLRSYSRYFAQSAQHGWENDMSVTKIRGTLPR